MRQEIMVCSIVLWSIGSLFCSESNYNPSPVREKRSIMSIEKVLSQNKEALMALQGVVGTAQSLCEGQPCIKVYVAERSPSLEKQIGDLLKGHLFQIQTSGKFKIRPPEP